MAGEPFIPPSQGALAQEPTPRAGRRRLPADAARERILDAAERALAEVGPEGLRLTELATQLGVSHPAILHHFGSRGGLVAAVIARALAKLDRELGDAISQGRRDGDNILERIAVFLAERGNARTVAWLVLSGRAHGLAAAPPRVRRPPALRRLVDLVHARRMRAAPGVELDDTLFRAQLSIFALLGEAIFGDVIRRATGDERAEGSRDFRQRLARLLGRRD
jgi:TetR/AcrR family transcriptional regulator, repressor for neighboring sulfatase